MRRENVFSAFGGQQHKSEFQAVLQTTSLNSDHALGCGSEALEALVGADAALPCKPISAARPGFAGDAHPAATEEVTVTINNPISLICEALAHPSPNITWLKDEVPLKASRNIHLLPGTMLGSAGSARAWGPLAACPGEWEQSLALVWLCLRVGGLRSHHPAGPGGLR